MNLAKPFPGVIGEHLVSSATLLLMRRQQHRGCVTPDILRTLAVTDLGSVAGFSSIKCAVVSFHMWGSQQRNVCAGSRTSER